MSQFLDLQKIDKVLVNLAIVTSFTDELSTKKYKTVKAKLEVQSQAYEALQALKKDLNEYRCTLPKKDLKRIAKAIRKLESQLGGFSPINKQVEMHQEASINESFTMSSASDESQPLPPPRPTTSSSTFALSQSIEARRARSASRNKPKRINFKEPVVVVTEKKSGSTPSKSSQSTQPSRRSQSSSVTVGRGVGGGGRQSTRITSYLPDTQIIPNTPESSISTSSQADLKKRAALAATLNQQQQQQQQLLFNQAGSLRIRLIQDNELIPLKEYPDNFWHKLSVGQIDIPKFFGPLFDN